MICDIGDYLKPLATFNRTASDGTDVQQVSLCAILYLLEIADSKYQQALVAIYGDLLKFFCQARLVIVNKDGTIKSMCISVTSLIPLTFSALGTFRTFL